MAICKDGIVVSAESRGNIFDKTDSNQVPMAYFDGIPKIFPIGNNVIAITGQGAIGGVFFSAIVNDFNNVVRPTEIDKLLPNFIDFCKRKYPSDISAEIELQLILAGGYLDSIPTICYFSKNQPGGAFGYIQRTGAIASDRSSLDDFSEQLISLSGEETLKLTEQAIELYASEGERWKAIGGPINSLLVTPSNIRWLKNSAKNFRWVYVRDFYNDCVAGGVSLTYIDPYSQQDIRDLIP